MYTLKSDIKSLFDYLTVWIKDNGQETIKLTCEVYKSQTRFHLKVRLIQICFGIPSSFIELWRIMRSLMCAST